MEAQSYSACSICTRHHIRYNQTHHVDTKGRYETVGTPHHEISTLCGHAVDTYTGARGVIIRAMSSVYSYSWVWRGNAEGRLQCNGQLPHNDGWVAWINIG
jgi:hypothetical protein